MALSSLLEIIKKTAGFLEGKGVEHPRLNAELLIGHALGLKRMELYLQFERLLPEAELEKIRPLVRRRGQREPLQHIVGSVEFGEAELKVDRRALIPRPETEYLGELLGKELVGSPPATVLDLGTGTGALAIALAGKWPEATVWATDISADALSLAQENVEANGLADRVRLLQSDWFDAIPSDQRFDLIVANPPYLTEQEVAEAAPEVRQFEPAVALSSPDEGRAALVVIIDRALEFLAPDGCLALETGIAQHATLSARMRSAGFGRVESRTDLAERDRFLIGWVR